MAPRNEPARSGLYFLASQKLQSGLHGLRRSPAYWLAASGATAGADAPFFIFCFFGFLTCFVVGGEYELTELDAAGAAVCASAAEAPTANETAVNNSASFFI